MAHSLSSPCRATPSERAATPTSMHVNGQGRSLTHLQKRHATSNPKKMLGLSGGRGQSSGDDIHNNSDQTVRPPLEIPFHISRRSHRDHWALTRGELESRQLTTLFRYYGYTSLRGGFITKKVDKRPQTRLIPCNRFFSSFVNFPS